MLISRVETFLVPPRWLFVRIETDAGVVGWGEDEPRRALKHRAYGAFAVASVGDWEGLPTRDELPLLDAWQDPPSADHGGH